MTQIITSHFLVQRLLQEVHSCVQKPISHQELVQLFQKLTHAQNVCVNAENQEEIITLYGKAVDAFNLHVKKEIDQLRLLKNKQTISQKIQELQKTPGISESNLCLLRILQNHGRIPVAQSLPAFLSLEEREKACEDIFELASFFYEENIQKIPSGMLLLSDFTRKRLYYHFRILQKNQDTQINDRISIVQALFATAYEIGNVYAPSYPTEEEIQAFFLEKNRIMISARFV